MLLVTRSSDWLGRRVAEGARHASEPVHLVVLAGLLRLTLLPDVAMFSDMNRLSIIDNRF
jgi:hypothetical protein